MSLQVVGDQGERTLAIVSTVVFGMVCWALHRKKPKSASYEMMNKQ